MLTRVTQGLKTISSTSVPTAVSVPNDTVKQILDHAKKSGLVDQLCLCLVTAGSSLISGSSNMLRAACEACSAIWLLVDASESLSMKRNAYSFPLNTWHIPSLPLDSKDQDQGSLIGTESTKLVAAVTRAFLRSKAVQVALHYCLHQRIEASLHAGIQVFLSSFMLRNFCTHGKSTCKQPNFLHAEKSISREFYQHFSIIICICI